MLLICLYDAAGTLRHVYHKSLSHGKMKFMTLSASLIDEVMSHR